MRDDIDRARRSGYSDEQILSVLSDDPAQKAEIEGALKNGYTAGQVLSVFQEEAGASKREAIKGQGWGDYAADLGRAVVYGAGQEAKAVATGIAQPSDARTNPDSTFNRTANALQAASTIADAQTAGYKPAQFDILHPIDTASELPKAAAEAAPGLGASLLAGAGGGAVYGAVGGAVAGPIGAAIGGTLGGLGGAALYGLARYTGQNAQAHAEAQGRSEPKQSDFDATRGESLAMSGVDALGLKGGGFIGKSARGGLAMKAAQGAKNAGSLAASGAVNSAIGQTAAMDETRPDSDSLIERIGQVDLHEAANAGATGAALGGMVRLARAPAAIAGEIKYRAGGPINEAALTRVLNDMNSDAFPGDVSNRRQTGANLQTAAERYGRRVEAFAKDPSLTGLSEDGVIALRDAQSFLKTGAVMDERQLERVNKQIGDNEAFNAIADVNAVNRMSDTAGVGKSRSLIATALRNPGKAGAVGGAISEGLPLITGGLNIATGGKLAGAAMGAKALSKALGVDRVMNDPLGSYRDRYANRAPNDPTAIIPTAERTAADIDRLNGAVREMQPDAAPQVAPQAAPAPEAAPAHPPLADLIGATAPPRFTPQPSQTGRRAILPDQPMGERPMGTSDILSEIRLQAEGEGRPLLEVAQEQHRSLRSMETNTGLPEPLRNAAKAQAHAIHTDILAPMEAAFGGKADPLVSRSRSFKQVDEAPAPAPVISEAGAMRLQSELAPTVEAITRSASEGAARRTIESFIETFPVRDRDFVRQTLAQDPQVAKQTNVVRLKASAKASTALNRAKSLKTPKKRGRPRKNG